MPWKSKEAQRKRAKERYHNAQDDYKNKIRVANKSYDNKRKVEWKQFKAGLECSVCGEKEALCFHHKNPIEKEFNLSQYITKTKQQIREELAKCEVLCLNCHYKKHKEDNFATAKKAKNKRQNKTIVVRPKKEELEIAVFKKPISWLSKEYKVSSNTIKKWCHSYGIKYPQNRYWLRKENIVFIKGPEYII